MFGNIKICCIFVPGFKIEHHGPGRFPETVLTFFIMAININSNPNIREYRVMYLFGAWVTKEIIFAESDDEAKYDAAESAESLKNWPYAVALFCGNRKVVSYK